VKKPTWERGNVRLYLGDCREVLPTLDAGSVDAVITDPPYGVNYKYNEAFDDSPEAWILSTRVVWPQCMRVATGPVVWFGASPCIRRDLLTFGDNPMRTMVWAPKFTLSKTGAHGMMFKWHPIYGWRLPAKHDGPTWDVLDHMTECGNWWNHVASKPLALMETLVGFCMSGGMSLDPYMGSGTTGVAAVQTGRAFIGIEIDPTYFEIAVRRIDKAIDAGALFAPVPPAVREASLFEAATLTRAKEAK